MSAAILLFNRDLRLRDNPAIVDGAMRQLQREGRMHKRARMIAASFLVKDLYLGCRWGANHFWDLLTDGEIANNAGHWQWVAGTGNDTRPNRIFNPLRQARRFDPEGEYVRRYAPELAGIEGAAVHEPTPTFLTRRARRQRLKKAPGDGHVLVPRPATSARFWRAKDKSG